MKEDVHKQRIVEMHDSLVAPDGEGVPDPLPGQMPFEQIVSLSEFELDEYIAVQLPKGAKPFKGEPYADKEADRVELKRLTLARLMGYSLYGPEIQSFLILKLSLRERMVAI